MATSVDIVPSLGQGLSYLQEGPGASPGYAAIDRRRMLVAAGVREGLVHEGAYKVTAAGTGLTVLVAASAGMVNIQGDSVALQGIYSIAPHNSDITLDIAAGHATLPRNDLVVLEALDDDHDGGGLNKGRVRVVTGTPTSAAVQTDAFGIRGTPTLGNSQFPLAVVGVPALDSVITTSQIDDRRLRTAGVTTIATSESRTNAAYGLLATPDSIRNLVVPAGHLIYLSYIATWQESVSGAARAAIFLGANQLKTPPIDNTGSKTLAAQLGGTGIDSILSSWQHGLISNAAGSAVPAEVTTGQTIGVAFLAMSYELGGSSAGSINAPGGPCGIKLAPGTYDVSVQFKSSSGSVTAKNRELRVWTQPFPG